MTATLLFVDDCYDREHTKVASLTAVAVPLSEYPRVRAAFHKLLEPHIVPRPNTINVNPPEVHGADLLPGSDDETKIALVAGIVELVRRSRLQVYRVGYRLTDELLRTFRSEDRPGMGLCWFGILSVCQALFASDVVIPILDSADKHHVPTYSQPVRFLDIMRPAGQGRSISIQNSQNLAEVLYADSRFASLIQLTDIISYLRHIVDWNASGLEVGAFKKKLVPLAQSLEPAIVYEEVIDMQFGAASRGDAT